MAGRGLMLPGRRLILAIWVLLFIFHILINSASATSDFLSAPFLDLVPSNPLALPGSQRSPVGSDTVQVSSSVLRDFLPKVPNLEFGFNYLFGKNLRQSSWTVDYLLPLRVRSNGVFFGELHGNFLSYKSNNWVPFLNNFWNLTAPGARSRVDLSVGSGYRRMFGQDLMLGANSFYDVTFLLGNCWISSGLGIEMAANGPGDSAFDLNFNYYSPVYGEFNSRGSVFPTFNIVNDIRKGEASFDLEAGYSIPVLERSMDLRMKITGYQFGFGNHRESGWKTGGELTTADGVFRLSAEYGKDGVFGSYGIVGGYVNIGFRIENLLKGESPFDSPEPVFRSPRNFTRLLTRPVKRNWLKPSSLVANATCEGTPDDSQFQLPVNVSGFYKGFSPGLVAFMHYLGFQIVTDTAGGQGVNVYVAAHSGSNYTRDQEPMFKCMSAAYARAARGSTVVLFRRGTYSDRSSMFYQIELPALLSNPNVTEIRAYEANVSDSSLSIPADPSQWDQRPDFK
ncbi:MAG: inverse autotransporter beta domain-containing protein [Desulfomonile tiedjei]|uniref:Inverse autotransporter beta domain-containing protein n=1 Tax=Desulfomonile tiedjei TaxID=2358 RepID=A0A9D6V0I8_9BACT|nr:inverse autotransporter beta domain-containing protein [Desulfomonile tiedjei]